LAITFCALRRLPAEAFHLHASSPLKSPSHRMSFRLPRFDHRCGFIFGAGLKLVLPGSAWTEKPVAIRQALHFAVQIDGSFRAAPVSDLPGRKTMSSLYPCQRQIVLNWGRLARSAGLGPLDWSAVAANSKVPLESNHESCRYVVRMGLHVFLDCLTIITGAASRTDHLAIVASIKQQTPRTLIKTEMCFRPYEFNIRPTGRIFATAIKSKKHNRFWCEELREIR